MINRNPIRVNALCFNKDKAREHLSMGAYNNVRNQDTAERYVLNSVDTSKTRRARTNRGVRDQGFPQRNALCFKRRRYEQDKAREHLSTGAYNNVRNQDKAERNAVLRSIYVV